MRAALLSLAVVVAVGRVPAAYAQTPAAGADSVVMESPDGAGEWVGEAPWQGEYVDGYGVDAYGYDTVGPYCDDCAGYACGGFCGPHFSVKPEVLLWWMPSMRVPKLVTTSPNNTPRENAGVLGDGFADTATTRTLFGGGRADDERFAAGGRIELGWWTDSEETLGFVGNFFMLEDVEFGYSAASGGDPILARPFFNVAPAVGDPRQAASLLAYPGELGGSIDIRGVAEFYGAEVLLQESWFGWNSSRIDVSYGYRGLRFQELLQINDSLEFLVDDGPILAGTTIIARDDFETRNIFHGGQFGMNWRRGGGRFTTDVGLKLALGNVTQRAKIAGQSTTSVPGGGSVTSAGGLLALPTNIGEYERNRFATLLDFKLGCDWCWTPRAKITLAYQLTYLNRVLRPGDQIDLNVNDSQLGGGTLTGTAAPLFAYQETDFWAQGLNVGFEYRR